MNSKIIMFGLIVISILGVTACGIESQDNDVGEKKIYVVEPRILATQLFYSGNIRPINSHTVVSPTDGRILSVNVKFGQTSKKDSLLLTISATTVAEEYQKAVTEFLKSRDAFNKAEIDFNAHAQLWQDGIISQNEYIGKKSVLDNTRIAVLQATRKLQVALDEIDIELEDILKLNISKEEDIVRVLEQSFDALAVRAKISGVLLEPSNSDKKADAKLAVGNEVKKGQSLVLIGDLSGVSVHVNISEIDLDKISVGQEAIITGIAFPNFRLTGVIESIDSQASSTSGASSGLPTFPAVIGVKNLTPEQSSMIRVGMSSKVQINIKKENVIMVPIDAVYQQRGQSYVKLITDNGELSEVEITTAETNYNDVVVTSGLKIDDQVSYIEKDTVIVDH